MCLRHLMSGFRRIVPRPVHGASSKTRSKRPIDCGSKHQDIFGKSADYRYPLPSGVFAGFFEFPGRFVNAEHFTLVFHHHGNVGRLDAQTGAKVEDALFRHRERA